MTLYVEAQLTLNFVFIVLSFMRSQASIDAKNSRRINNMADFHQNAGPTGKWHRLAIRTPIPQ
ncbi:hypothetical protein BTO02_06865 [Paraburkholderia sp. SOS3]|nr:hypothetical protein BTO02_06865 [Paraburkholderia sp. SOS3]